MDFIEKTSTNSQPPRCVDGRPDPKSPQGPQMLGGSLHPLVLETIIANSNFDILAVENALGKLKEAGLPIGVHRGRHKNSKQGKSDCGFSDRLIAIIQTAKKNKVEIIKRLEDIYFKNGIGMDTLQTSYNFISNYNPENIKITGENLIGSAERNQAAMENLEGNHQEQAAFVNLKENTTFDTLKTNKQGKQAFNLDLWAAIKQSSILTKNANAEILRDLSLILYVATEMVLAEQKGKPPLSVFLYK